MGYDWVRHLSSTCANVPISSLAHRIEAQGGTHLSHAPSQSTFSACFPLVANHFQADELKGEASSKTGALINAGAVWCGFKRTDCSHEATAKYTTPWPRLGGREPEDDRVEAF